MIFEQALSALRKGKKITHPRFDPDVYLMACYLTLKYDPDDTFEKAQERGMSIVKMRGDVAHEDMGSGNIDNIVYTGTLIIEEHLEKPCKHGYFPQLNLFLLISDEWEIYDYPDKKETP